jgi:hypothetical protein
MSVAVPIVQRKIIEKNASTFRELCKNLNRLYFFWSTSKAVVQLRVYRSFLGFSIAPIFFFIIFVWRLQKFSSTMCEMEATASIIKKTHKNFVSKPKYHRRRIFPYNYSNWCNFCIFVVFFFFLMLKIECVRCCFYFVSAKYGKRAKISSVVCFK